MNEKVLAAAPVSWLRPRVGEGGKGSRGGMEGGEGTAQEQKRVLVRESPGVPPGRGGREKVVHGLHCSLQPRMLRAHSTGPKPCHSC
jgi:hypothetical protein